MWTQYAKYQMKEQFQKILYQDRINKVIGKIMLTWSIYDIDRKPLPKLVGVKGMIVEVEDIEFEEIKS